MAARLTEEQMQQFIRDGWVVASGLLAPERVAATRDELLAELRSVAADEWEQALSEAERELHEAMRKARTEGRQRLQGGERRELFGIGDRYRTFRGDEKAIEKAFAEDTHGLRRPAYFRFILTVDDRAAERFSRLDGTATERAIRDTVQKTFRGVARDVHGVSRSTSTAATSGQRTRTSTRS